MKSSEFAGFHSLYQNCSKNDNLGVRHEGPPHAARLNCHYYCSFDTDYEIQRIYKYFMLVIETAVRMTFKIKNHFGCIYRCIF